MLRRSVSYGIVPSDRFDPGPELGQNEQRDTLVCQANLMGWDVFHLLKGRSEGNLLFSPASAALCLGALRAGAQDRTGAELETVLHLRTSGRGGLDRALSEPEITPAFAAFLQSMLAKEATHGYDLRIAGSLTLAGRKNYPPAFSEAARRLGIETVDCASTDPAAFQKKVEAWTSEAMRSMFAKGAAVQPATMATGGAMRVVVAFHGNWQSPFDAQATKPAEFHAGAKRWQVPMMRSLEPLNYLEIDGVQIVEKSYRGHTVSLIVLLPRDRPAALVALEKRLNAATIENWLNRSREATVDFRLPRFRLNFAVDLRAPVIDLGLSTAFEKSKANFQGINNSVGTSPWLDGFDQLVEVRIDEGGAPAKAEPQPIMGGGVSPMMGGGFSGDMARMLWSAEVPVHADHPFVFLIRDLRTGAIVFIGRYAGPDETITVGDDRLRLGE